MNIKENNANDKEDADEIGISAVPKDNGKGTDSES